MDLICYTFEGWEPRIRPASPKRDWMEETPERFAYRCLPLAIANSHGWEILSPCGFEARWNGGPRVEDVEVRLDPGARKHNAPVPLFGQGVLTFHVEGLFRTSEGWNLWVGGPPNGAKDGIAPLGGVIETDWSPYSFTMNWRFTRPGQWVRFEENEPFAFFFPVQRGLLDGIKPELRSIETDPELKASFQSWSRSRDAFQAWVKETEPSAPADKWQKLYYRGVRPDGRDGPKDHDSKLRLDPFRQPDGTPMVTGECPVRKAPATAAPKPAILSQPPMRTVPMSDFALNLSLQRIGFEAAPQVPERHIGLPLKAEAPTSDVPGKRRQWLLDTMERQRALSPRTGTVPRVRGLSGEEFLDQYYAPGRPVVIEGEMADWPALKRWSPLYLRKALGKAPVEYQAGRNANPDFELDKDRHRQRLPFGKYMDLIQKGDGNDAYITAYNSAANAAALKPLERDLLYLEKYLTRAHGMMWIGPAGTFTPLHFDLTNNLLAQVIGEKKLVLLPPSEGGRLHHNRHVFSEVHDIEDEARLARFPSARQARRFEVDLKPGDLLYVPIGWWHQVRSASFSVMLTYTNFRWSNAGHDSYPADAA